MTSDRGPGASSLHWRPAAWRGRTAAQQPAWPDDASLEQALKHLSSVPPLVFAGEARALTAQLAEVAEGRAFLLQAGDCAESFDAFSADAIRDKLKVILQMAVVLTYSTGVPVIKVGRIAVQFAKPRSAESETIGDVELPSFRGHMVNDSAPNEAARVPDPNRLVQAYHQSAATLNLLRAFTKGGFADLSQVHQWNQQFVASSPAGRRYDGVADQINRAHERLILGYEGALPRQDSLTGDWYDCSAHMLWIGERSRQIDGAHVEFLRGVGNPVGCKLGPRSTPDEVLALCEALNPQRIPGRLTFIPRMGAGSVATRLSPLLAAVRDARHPVVWACDPMHGNTFTSDTGRKTRDFDAVLAEIAGFFAAHWAEDTWPGGVHIELTGEDVTECLGGGDALGHADLDHRYETMCDPRLNGRQSIDLAFQVAELLHRR